MQAKSIFSLRFNFFCSFIICFFFLSREGLAQNVNLQQGLKIHLDFNRNLDDLSGANEPGEQLGSFYALDRFGNCEFALGFDNHLQLARLDEGSVNGLQDFSISLWFKKEGGGFGTILSVANASRDNELNINVTADGRLASNIRNLPNIPGIRIDGNTSIAEGDWYHVVLTRNGTTGNSFFYLNNIQDGSKQMPLGVIQVGVNGFVLGNDQDCLAGCYDQNQQFRGAVDDLRVYDRVINADEIEALFQFEDGVVDQTNRGSSTDLTSCDNSVELAISRNFDRWTWSTGSQQERIQVGQSGQYIVTGFIRDCEYKDTTNVIINTIPSLTIETDQTDLACAQTIVITASAGFDEYIWQDGSMGQSFTATEPGFYRVTGTHDCGPVMSNVVELTRSTIPSLQVTASSEVIDCEESIDIEATEGFDSYEWNNGATGRELLVVSSGVYSVVATDVCGNQVQASITITQSTSQPYFIPNTFTPNGDGKNDFFEVDARLAGYQMKIVSRWGKQVYSSQNYQNDWDGNGLPEGSYYYLLTGPCLTEAIKGWVQIIR